MGFLSKINCCILKETYVISCTKTFKFTVCFLVLVLCIPVVKADNGSLTINISDPNPAPVVGETFETTIDFTTDYTVLGAYHLTVHYDPDTMRILNITIPFDSEFHNNTFVDSNSFSSGQTEICAFQTENSADQPIPETLAVIQWELTAEATPCSKIFLVPETLTDAFWEPIKDVNISTLSLSEEKSPPSVDLFTIPGPQRSTVRFIQVQFEKHVILSKNALIIEGQNTGLVDLSTVEFSYWNHFYDIWPATTAYWLFPDSLPDDIYTATVVATEVSLASDPSIILDGDGNCLSGGNQITNFHLLFGDATGDKVVNFEDLNLLASRWLKTPEYTGLDANNDNIINFVDFARFAKNWSQSFE